MVTQSSLNTVRMIEGEGVIEGYLEVPDSVLEVARQTGLQKWDEVIADLSEGGSSPSRTREKMLSVTNELDFDASCSRRCRRTTASRARMV